MTFRAEDEVRTRDLQLGRLSLYQLSYFRVIIGKSSIGIPIYRDEIEIVNPISQSAFPKFQNERTVGKDGFEPPNS